MKAYQVSASIVAYKNDPADVTAAVRSVLSAPLRVMGTVINNSSSPELRIPTVLIPEFSGIPKWPCASFRLQHLVAAEHNQSVFSRETAIFRGTRTELYELVLL